MSQLNLIEPASKAGFMISLVMLGFFGGLWLNMALGQNGTGVDDGGDIIADFKDTVVAIATLVSVAGVVIGLIGNSRAQKISKFAQTFGNKTVELSSAIYRVGKAADFATQGEVSKQLEKVKTPMSQLKESADKAREQLEYLAPKESLPNDPDKDPAMPRESFKAKRGTDDIDPLV